VDVRERSGGGLGAVSFCGEEEDCLDCLLGLGAMIDVAVLCFFGGVGLVGRGLCRVTEDSCDGELGCVWGCFWLGGCPPYTRGVARGTLISYCQLVFVFEVVSGKMDLSSSELVNGRC